RTERRTWAPRSLVRTELTGGRTIRADITSPPPSALQGKSSEKPGDRRIIVRRVLHSVRSSARSPCGLDPFGDLRRPAHGGPKSSGSSSGRSQGLGFSNGASFGHGAAGSYQY